MHTLELRNVNSGYMGKPVLHDISVTATGSSVYVVLGPNGAGKTTLFRTIAGILEPMAGNILLDGKESNNLEESEVIGVSDNDYVIYDNKTEQKVADVIKDMTTKDARGIGLSKRHLFRLKKRIKEGKKIALERKTLNKLNRKI